MRMKHILSGIVMSVLILASCTQGDLSVGSGIRPDEDDINVRTDTFKMEMKTLRLDSIYAKSTSAALGEIYDPLYGKLKSDYITQFYCPEDFQFRYDPLEGKIDSIELYMYYTTWQGDSLVAMEAEIFSVTEPLNRHYYSNFDPSVYSDKKNSLGKKAYSAFDPSIPDSIRSISGFVPSVAVELPWELGQRFYEESVNNPATFSSQQNFDQFFPGIYATNTYGSGNVLDIIETRIYIYYKYDEYNKDVNGNDSIVTKQTAEILLSTPEIIQLNRFENSQIDHLLEPNDEYTYLKSPAGVYTQIIMPTDQMASAVDERTVNNLNLRLVPMPEDEWEYAYVRPSSVLLIPQDSFIVHFEERRTYDGITSYLAELKAPKITENVPWSRQYSFDNIANLLNVHIAEKPDEELILMVIPVKVVYDSSGSMIGLENLFETRGAAIRTGGDFKEIQVTSSKFKSKN